MAHVRCKSLPTFIIIRKGVCVMGSSPMKATGLVELTNGSDEIAKYNLFYLQLTDNWVSANNTINCLYNRLAGIVTWTFDSGSYQNNFSLSLTGNTFSVLSQYSSTPNQVKPTIAKIWGIC